MWMWEKYTTLLHWLFFFFFITEGKQGPPQSLPHHKYGGEMSVCFGRNAQEKEKKTEEGNNTTFKKEGRQQKMRNLFVGIFT